ncbi:MAG: hypothetical protein HeimC2_32190 [Candidatus Heimdallarchaeota archaeon LC_2]|nr:MAG: hypothetical protein HeimC2_32190 [Candidatus Heimdallarchaeota archaeon LC_2]
MNTFKNYNNNESWKKRSRYISNKLRKEVINKYENSCGICNKQFINQERIEMDHIVEFASGGRTELSNLRPVCIRCHKDRSYFNWVDNRITPFKKTYQTINQHDIRKCLCRTHNLVRKIFKDYNITGYFEIEIRKKRYLRKNKIISELKKKGFSTKGIVRLMSTKLRTYTSDNSAVETLIEEMVRLNDLIYLGVANNDVIYGKMDSYLDVKNMVPELEPVASNSYLSIIVYRGISHLIEIHKYVTTKMLKSFVEERFERETFKPAFKFWRRLNNEVKNGKLERVGHTKEGKVIYIRIGTLDQIKDKLPTNYCNN